MFSALKLILTLATLAEKLIPFASKLVDAYLAERTRRALAAEQASKDARNAKAIEEAVSSQQSAISPKP